MQNKINIISVIIPVYNPGKYFDRCVDRLVNQTYKNLEIILVDDGSTDGSSEKCDEWASKDSRIIVIHKENGGASSARNAGLDVASGEFIGFVDSDDYIDYDMYEIMLDEIIEYNADAVRCGVIRESDDGITEDWGTGNYEVRIVDKEQLLKDVGAAEGILPVSLGNKLYRITCIGDIRFDTKYKFAEDTLFNFMISRNINTMVYHDINRYHYRFNSSSITSNEINENNFDEHRVMDVIFSIADKETLPYCFKGDVLKSFRTIRQMILADKYMERYLSMRHRILSHFRVIMTSSIYSRKTKLRTLLLVFPKLYIFVIKHFRKG